MNILLLDDDYRQTSSLARFFTLRGHATTEARNGVEALLTIEASGPFDVIISDYDFGAMDVRNGVEICTELRLLHSSATHFIICSALQRAVPEWITFLYKGDLQGLIDAVEVKSPVA
jgi:CheY-like chemotaxis protein